MSIVLATLKAIHLLALVFGSAASMGNIYLALSTGPHDLTAPGFTNTLRKAYRLTALGAIIALWASGVLLTLWQYGGWVPGTAFAVKILLTVLLTAIILFVNLMAPGWARRSGPPRWVSTLHWTAAISLLLIVILAAYAFTW